MKLPLRLCPTLRHLPTSCPSTQVPTIIAVPDIVSQVSRGVPLGLRDTIPQPREPTAAVLKVVVLEPRLPQRLQVVQRRPRPRDGRLPPVGLDVVRVAAAVGPDHALRGARHVRPEVVRRGRLEAHAVDAGLRLVPVDEGADKVGLGLEGDDDGPVGDGRPGPAHGEGVGALGDADAHVSRDGGGPVLLEVVPLEEHRVAWDEGDVEARGADDDVALVGVSVVVDAAGFSEGFDA